MTSDANGWPDASKPGVPMNPERDGIHLLAQGDFEMVAEWSAKEQKWMQGGLCCGGSCSPGYAASATFEPRVRYLGPCLTPAEAQHRERAAAAAAWLAARDDAADIADGIGEHGSALEIRALPPPANAAAALAEVVRKAKAEEREACMRLWANQQPPFVRRVEWSIKGPRGEGGE